MDVFPGSVVGLGYQGRTEGGLIVDDPKHMEATKNEQVKHKNAGHHEQVDNVDLGSLQPNTLTVTMAAVTQQQ